MKAKKDMMISLRSTSKMGAERPGAQFLPPALPYTWHPHQRSANHILDIIDLYIYFISLDCNKVSILIKSVH